MRRPSGRKPEVGLGLGGPSQEERRQSGGRAAYPPEYLAPPRDYDNRPVPRHVIQYLARKYRNVHRTVELAELGAKLALFVLWKGHQEDPVFSATHNRRANDAGADDAPASARRLMRSSRYALM